MTVFCSPPYVNSSYEQGKNIQWVFVWITKIWHSTQFVTLSDVVLQVLIIYLKIYFVFNASPANSITQEIIVQLPPLTLLPIEYSIGFLSHVTLTDFIVSN